MSSTSVNQKLAEHARQRGAQLGLIPKESLFAHHWSRFGPELGRYVMPGARWGAIGLVAIIYLAEPYFIYKRIPGTWAWNEERKKQ